MACNALLVSDQDRYAGLHNVDQWLNPAVFANPLVAKTIGQSDFLIEFRAESFNLTNTQNLANPGSLNIVDTKNFDKITSTRHNANDPRQIQLALKIYF